MKAFILYHPNSEHGLSTETFVHDFNDRNSHQIELMSLETREGADKAQVYDITQYPAVVVTTDDGVMQKMWQGPQLPLASEVLGYLAA